MGKVFASPSRYVQGKDVLKTGLSHVLVWDRLPFFCDPIVCDLVGKELEENLVKEGAFVHREIFPWRSNQRRSSPRC